MRTKALLAIVLLLATAGASFGAVFTVALKNGTTFDTRYRPVDAEWDDSVSMILTDQGNWVALAKEDIADVTSSVEVSGFGYQLNTNTILLGWTYNEGLGEGEEGQEGAAGAGAGGLPEGGADFDDGGPQAEPYTIDQFVDSGAAGGGGGIPLDYIRN